ncbi:hypothetical protein, partial [Nostoc sp.]|uniref:hypothetical protein n=1 Tax=Nostoc sp. TaxID=1180 RepID=UPI002FF692D6
MFEKFLVMYQILLDPPKSPLKRGTLRGFAPLFKGRAVSFHKGKKFVNIMREKSLSSCDGSMTIST